MPRYMVRLLASTTLMLLTFIEASSAVPDVANLILLGAGLLALAITGRREPGT